MNWTVGQKNDDTVEIIEIFSDDFGFQIHHEKELQESVDSTNVNKKKSEAILSDSEAEILKMDWRSFCGNFSSEICMQ